MHIIDMHRELKHYVNYIYTNIIKYIIILDAPKIYNC